MNKTRLISFIALGLLVVNLMLTGYIYFGQNNRPLQEGPKKIIAERLHFDANQIAAYEKLIAIHRMKIKTKDSLISLVKNQLYVSIIAPDVILKDSLENKLGQLQIEIEEINYNHFLDIKKLCKENQLLYFNELVIDLTDLFAKPNQIKRN